MPSPPRASNRYLLQAVAAGVVVASGLYLVFASGRQGDVPAVLVASLQLCAGALLLWHAVRSRPRDQDS